MFTGKKRTFRARSASTKLCSSQIWLNTRTQYTTASERSVPIAASTCLTCLNTCVLCTTTPKTSSATIVRTPAWNRPIWGNTSWPSTSLERSRVNTRRRFNTSQLINSYLYGGGGPRPYFYQNGRNISIASLVKIWYSYLSLVQYVYLTWNTVLSISFTCSFFLACIWIYEVCYLIGFWKSLNLSYLKFHEVLNVDLSNSFPI